MAQFCCKACTRHKDVEHSADPHKPLHRQTCKACSEKIRACAKRNAARKSNKPANLDEFAKWAAHV